MVAGQSWVCELVRRLPGLFVQCSCFRVFIPCEHERVLLRGGAQDAKVSEDRSVT
jgi:hypothetical protein